MRMRNIIAFILISLLFYDLKAQEKNLTIRDKSNMDYLPQIEEILTNIRNFKTDYKVFDRVYNLNTLEIADSNKKELNDFLNTLQDIPPQKDDQQISDYKKKILNQLKHSSIYFIINSINPKNNKLLFNIIIYDIIPPNDTISSKNIYPYPGLINGRMKNFIIDTSVEDHKINKQLEKEIKKIFNETQQAPILTIKSNLKKCNDGYY